MSWYVIPTRLILLLLILPQSKPSPIQSPWTPYPIPSGNSLSGVFLLRLHHETVPLQTIIITRTVIRLISLILLLTNILNLTMAIMITLHPTMSITCFKRSSLSPVVAYASSAFMATAVLLQPSHPKSDPYLLFSHPMPIWSLWMLPRLKKVITDGGMRGSTDMTDRWSTKDGKELVKG